MSQTPKPTEQEIIARLDVIGSIARERMLQCDNAFVASRGGAEVDYMTREELREFSELKMMLPTFAELREAALERISLRIAKRRKSPEL